MHPLENDVCYPFISPRSSSSDKCVVMYWYTTSDSVNNGHLWEGWQAGQSQYYALTSGVFAVTFLFDNTNNFAAMHG